MIKIKEQDWNKLIPLIEQNLEYFRKKLETYPNDEDYKIGYQASKNMHKIATFNAIKHMDKRFDIDKIAGKDRLPIDQWVARFKTRLMDHWKMTEFWADEWIQSALGDNPDQKMLYWHFPKDPEVAADDDKTYAE